MTDKKLITPRKLQGFWELMPNDEKLFESMLDNFKRVFENNCFLPLDTPVAEYSDILLAKSGGDLDKEIYRFTKGSNDICLRYDLTVPLARFVAMNANVLEFPFKRFQIGKVYRGERPQKGRFREFYQCDADVIGLENLPISYDAECISLYAPCFKSIGLDTTIEISNRKILAGFFESLNSTNLTDLMIIVDKVDKLPKEEINAMFKEKGLNDKDIENTFKIITTKGNIEEIKKEISLISQNQTFLEGIKELTELNTYLKAMNVEDYIFNLSIVRGHNYYTGTVFEAFIKNKRSLGAIGGGGRYDNLCGNFIDKNMQGVGMSIGITRLFDIMQTENMFENNKNLSTKIGIITFDETNLDGIKLMTKLRNDGVLADRVGEGKSFKSKMKESNRRNIPFVVILGKDEVKNGLYTLKIMKNYEKKTLTYDELLNEIK